MHKTIELFRNAILNVRIGKKLALVLGLIIALLALQVGLSTWSLQILIARMQQAQQQSSHMVLASRIASDLADLNTQMGYLTISADLKLDEAQVISLHRDQAAALAESNKAKAAAAKVLADQQKADADIAKAQAATDAKVKADKIKAEADAAKLKGAEAAKLLAEAKAKADKEKAEADAIKAAASV